MPVDKRYGDNIPFKLTGSITKVVSYRAAIHDTPRTAARWKIAISELETLGLIGSRIPKREIFFATEEGYAFAESFGVVDISQYQSSADLTTADEPINIPVRDQIASREHGPTRIGWFGDEDTLIATHLFLMQ